MVEPTVSTWDSDAWVAAAARLLKSQMRLADVTNAKLARRLTTLGCVETEASVKNKISRGSFTFAFFIQAMTAMGLREVNIAAVLPSTMPSGRELDFLAAKKDQEIAAKEAAIEMKVKQFTAILK